jgi:hypothetical protein
LGAKSGRLGSSYVPSPTIGTIQINLSPTLRRSTAFWAWRNVGKITEDNMTDRRSRFMVKSRSTIVNFPAESVKSKEEYF